MKYFLLFFLLPNFLFSENYPVIGYSDITGKKPTYYTEWKDSHPYKPLKKEVVFQSKLKYGPKYLIVITPFLVTALKNELKTFQNDLTNEGYSVTTLSWSGGDHQDLRKELQDRYSSGLKYALFIGDLPVAFYVNVDRNMEYPADFYFMDMDGNWEDSDNDGKLDICPQKSNPELCIGRLYASNLSWGTELSILKNYFRKNHIYRTGGYSSVIPHRALDFKDIRIDLRQNMEQAYDTVVTRNDWKYTTAANYRKDMRDGYEFVHLVVHSNPWCHSFMLDDYSSPGGGTYMNFEPVGLNPPCNFFVLETCMVVRFTEIDNIGNWYLFCNDYSVAVLGDTREAYALTYSEMYKALGEGNDLGESYRRYLNSYSSKQTDFVAGNTLLGDPSLKINTAQAPSSNTPLQVYGSETQLEQITNSDYVVGNVRITEDSSNRIWIFYNGITENTKYGYIGLAKYWDGSWSPDSIIVTGNGCGLSCSKDDRGGIWFGYDSMPEDENYDIYVRYNDGNSFSSSKRITTARTYDVETSLAYGKNGSMIIVYRNYDFGHGDLWSQSFDGYIWEPFGIKISTGSGENLMPKVSVTPDGNFITVWVRAENGRRDICWSLLKNGTWTSPQAIKSEVDGVSTFPQIASKNGSLYASWLHTETNGFNHIMLTEWYGNNFKTGHSVYKTDNLIATPYLLVTDEKQLYFSFTIRNGLSWDIAFMKSSNAAEWEEPKIIAPDPGQDLEPVLAQCNNVIKIIWFSDRKNGVWNIFGYDIEKTGFGTSETKRRLPLALNISVFPNPCNEKIIFQFTRKAETDINLKIYDINGRLIRNYDRMKPELNIKINTSKLSSGVYLYRIEAEGMVHTGRLLKTGK
ncbi:MAG: T9SS type A sorting domain-containing protein [Candidatus Coatesbacteria bacterium]|nr:T9SS type A sorting domain-containing protein [Candidatus Coatesbacteria bacterium]